MLPNKPNNISPLPRKIPGPTSKTLPRNQHSTEGGSLRAEEGELVHTTPGPGRQCESRPKSETSESLSTALIVIKAKQNKRLEMAGSIQTLQQSAVKPPQQKTTCLLCSDPVLIPREDENSKAAKDRNEAIKIVCFHLQMEPRDVPKTCTAEMFPFCVVCERHVTQLWEQEKIIQEAQKKVNKSVAAIERTVADAELLRATMKMTGPTSPTKILDEGKKFVKLREKILDGYRAKLLMKQKLRENLIFGNEIKQPAYSHTVIMEDKSLSRQYTSSRSSTSTSSLANKEMGENITVDNSSVDGGMNSSSVEDDQGEQANHNSASETEGDDSNDDINDSRLPVVPSQNVNIQPVQPVQRSPQLLPQQRLQIQQRDPRRAARKSTTTAWPGPRMTAQYNENSCTMVISDVRSDTEELHSFPIVVKQEPMEIATLAPTPVTPGKRKRRSLFQGIEICRVTDPRSNKIHLQCSICRLTVPITNFSAGMTPYQTMTHHIAEKHLGKRRRAALAKAALATAAATQAQPSETTSTRTHRKFTCKICAKVFHDMRTLLLHKSTHVPVPAPPPTNSSSSPPIASRKRRNSQYYTPGLECNICGRPVKGNQSNLDAHLFSHKNNEERKQSVAANERGARNALLRGQDIKPRRHHRIKPVILTKYPVKKVRRGKGKSRGLSSAKTARVLKEMAATGPIKCQVCYRTFSRKCHLALHMQGHARRSQLPVPPPKANKKPRSFVSVIKERVQAQKELVLANPVVNAGSHQEEEENRIENQEEQVESGSAEENLQGDYSNEEEMNYDENENAAVLGEMMESSNNINT